MHSEKGLIDLHVHTNRSDGSMSPADVVRLAEINRLKAIAITDHNTFDGVEDCMIAAMPIGIEIIAGVELSAEFSPEMHILCYFFDNRFLSLQSWLYDLRVMRHEDILQKVIEKLKKLQYNIDLNDVSSFYKERIYGVNAIAHALVKKRYFKTAGEAMDKLLGFGQAAYVPFRPSYAEIIEKITWYGGVAVLAHPFVYGLAVDELKELISDLKACGLKGIEVYHSEASDSMRKLIGDIADEFGLIKTGGSDFHGTVKPGIELGFGRDNLCLNYAIIDQLRAAAKE